MRFKEIHEQDIERNINGSNNTQNVEEENRLTIQKNKFFNNLKKEYKLSILLVCVKKI